MISGESTNDTSVLLDRARSGDPQAYAALYREYFPSVRRAALRMVRDQHEADDLAQEAFFMVFRALKAGRGPDESFAGYVMSTVRRLAYRHTTSRSHVWVTDDVASYESPQQSQSSSAMLDDANAAWASLPERWRQVLWLVEVERHTPAELAERFDMSPTAVSSLATRAREALRTAFLAQQVIGGDGRCAAATPKLAAYVRGTLAGRWVTSLAKHVEMCRPCQQRLSSLTENATRIGLTNRPARIDQLLRRPESAVRVAAPA